ncbi:protein CD300H-like [Erinaceus europaeus]|uniref:Protein CD300H-like n=1 Tax=Erinaceus europaeus TaxID=9365 RepID=A0ABM3YBL7_ERIEU|nr:protein CD300H-like [Erinaceus europaeus]
MTGTLGGSLSVQCEKKYKAFDRYWCRQPCLPFLYQPLKASGREHLVRSGQVSIIDHPADLTFTVTLETLNAQDAGKYRCGVDTILKDEGFLGFLPNPFVQVQVFFSPEILFKRCSIKVTKADHLNTSSTLS